MSKSNVHIISKLKWQNTFDQKESAKELQERISAWSKNHMQKEIEAIFDSTCPLEETWKISELELDLKEIDFDNLETDLSRKLCQQLSEKLIELILYSRGKKNTIEIFNEDTSHLNMLRTFLLNGLMPWNYTTLDGSVNKIMSYQIMQNKQNTINMLKKVGSASENTRKRIAWQLHEDNIIQIIKGLEPNSHDEIIHFSNQLTEIQQQGSIVQANKQDFKKNIWLWVLNYLFTDRGTIFNKVAFMKSSLLQMSSHYNIKYIELLNMLDLALENINISLSKKADFISIIHLLSKENEDSKESTKYKTVKYIDYWETLEQLFKNPTIRKTNSKNNEFNDLIMGLSRENKPKFKELITDVGSKKNLWPSAINDLTDDCLEIISFSISPVRANIVLDSIHFIHNLNKEMNFKIDRNTIWEIGINFLLNHKNSTFDSKIFLNYTFSELSKKNTLTTENWLKQLTNIETQSSSKTIKTLEIYSTISDMYLEEMTKNNNSFSKNQFNEILKEHYKQIRSNKINQTISKLFQNQIIQYIEINPSAALEVLLEFENKNQLYELLPYFLGIEQAKMLLKSGTKKVNILASINGIVQELKKEKKWVTLIAEIENDIITIGITTLILQPKISITNFIDYTIKELSIKMDSSQQTHFFEFIDELLLHKKIMVQLPRPVQMHGKEKTTFIKEEHDFMQQIKSQTLNEKGKQWYISQVLKQHFNNSVFKQLRQNNSKESEFIFKYLILNSQETLEHVLQEYIHLFTKKLTTVSKNDSSQEIINLFWKCLLDYSNHKGSLKRFKTMTTAAMMLHFSKSPKAQTSIEKIKWRNLQTHTIILKTGQELSLKQVYEFIKYCLNNEQTFILHEGQNIQFHDLLSLTIEQHSPIIKTIFYQTNITEKRIRFLQSVIEWQKFHSWIATNLLSEEKSILHAIRSLYELTTHLNNKNNENQWIQFFWKYTWNAIKAKEKANELFKQLINEVISKTVQKNNVRVDFIINEIRTNHISIPEDLKKCLIEIHSNFSKITDPLPTKVIARDLLQCEQLGLIEQLCYELILHKKIPTWYNNSNQSNTKTLIQDLMEEYHTTFATVIKHRNITQLQKQNLHELLDFKQLTTIIQRFGKNKLQLIATLEHFYNSLGQLSGTTISGKEIQTILFKKLIIAWTEDNWSIISHENIWQELIWEAVTKKRHSKKEFFLAMGKIKYSFPLSIQVALELLTKSDIEQIKIKEQTIAPIIKKQLLEKKKDTVLKTGITVKNAGIILLNNYVSILFERLGIVKNKQFINSSSQLDAVHYLQYVATGISTTEEHLLPLNKILCGLPISSAVPARINITDDQKKLISSLIKAVLSHWPSVGNSSIDGFRGNWLIRDGLLTEKDDRWELIVEKRVYDLLIHKSPFSFSIIKYSWMEKPIYVTWPY